MRLLLALTATLLLFVIPPAGASAYLSPGEPVADPQVDGWVAVARAKWGAAPVCSEGVRVDRAERLPDAGLWAAAEMPGCHVSLDPDFYPAPAAWTATAGGRAQWEEQMCNVVVHEWGHLLGRVHAEDPDDLMSPLVPRVVPGCRPGAPAARKATHRPARTRAAKRRSARRPPARRSAHVHVEGARGPVLPVFGSDPFP